jgi:hypothetical protein
MGWTTMRTAWPPSTLRRTNTAIFVKKACELPIALFPVLVNKSCHGR